jgi:hypothetical protein
VIGAWWAQGFSRLWPWLPRRRARPESIPNLAVARCNSDKAFLEDCLTSTFNPLRGSLSGWKHCFEITP